MITISLCMIVKNEADVLERCLASAKDIVDEINIVDTGSTDQTVEIAKGFTDRVFFYKWTGDFSAARNESMKYATKDYILYLDADDVILPEDQKKFLKLKETLNPNVDAVSMYYHAGTDGFGNVTLKYRLNRLLKRTKGFKWQGDCHNYLNVSGHIINSDIAITHKKQQHSVGRNLNIYQKRKERGDTFTARDYFYYGNELRENGHYQEAIDSYNKNLELKTGWIEDKVYACINKADCYRFLNQAEQELAALFQSLNYAKVPRPEICSRLGFHFQSQHAYQQAVFWYELATQLETDPNKWSFTYPAYSTWYPHLQLCVCYYKLGNFEKAFEHNERARVYRPEDERILYNKQLLENKRS
ncbi:glycosyltransferase [Amphibacillus jilinensis]|uniref:glycosyltransferase n=1 Tax=Amphibacillus jilinensis TaxID=1216008 RepID=UPI0002DB19FF|nr:glycosyltransferase [Amphibacillus jilinensis]